MFPLPISFYIYAGLTVLALAGFGYGKYESAKYDAFKAEVTAAGKAQEVKNDSIQKQSDLVSKGIKNEYEAKLSAVRNFYTSGVRNPSSGSMSGISPAPKGTNAETAYPILAGQCAQTTLQVNLWQEWATQNGLIK